jgi:hypothetical protein
MSAPSHASDSTGARWIGWLVGIVGAGVVLAEIVGMYLILDGFAVSEMVAYAGTAVTATVIGGSALFVAGRRVAGSSGPAETGEKSGVVRVAEIVVSVTVLTGVTVVLGSIGGIVLTVVATLGGPDPKTTDDELLRHRLLDWIQRNRDFMRNNGRGTLPLTP